MSHNNPMISNIELESQSKTDTAPQSKKKSLHPGHSHEGPHGIHLGNSVRRHTKHRNSLVMDAMGLEIEDNEHDRLTISLDRGNFFSNHILIRTIPKEAYNDKSIRGKLCRFCHDQRTQTVLNILLVIDLLIVITSIEVELMYKESQIEAYKESCTAGKDTLIGDHHLHDVEHKLMITSISILCIFLLEQIALLIGMGIEFFTKPMEVLDLAVVSISLYFELHADSFAAILLIISRTWRFIRIFHGMFTLDEDHEDEDHEDEDKNKNKKEAESESKSKAKKAKTELEK